MIDETRDNLDALIGRLCELGFSSYGAKVYIALVRESPATAYRISKSSGVPHAKVYENVRKLIDAGIVQTVSTSPEMYAPLPPKVLMNRIRNNFTHAMDDAEKELLSLPAEIEIEPVFTVHDPKIAVGRAIEIIEGAKQKLFVGVWDEELDTILPHLLDANNRGVWIATLVYGITTLPFGIYFKHSIEETERMRKVTGRNLDIVADTQVAMAGTLGAEQPCRIVWTRNQGLVRELEHLFAHDLYIAEIRSVIGEDVLDKHFGPNLARLREKYLQLDPFQQPVKTKTQR